MGAHHSLPGGVPRSGGVGCPLRPFLANTLLVLKPVPGLPDARRLLEHPLKRRSRAALFPYLKFADRLANQRGRGHTTQRGLPVQPRPLLVIQADHCSDKPFNIKT